MHSEEPKEVVYKGYSWMKSILQDLDDVARLYELVHGMWLNAPAKLADRSDTNFWIELRNCKL